VPQDPFLFRGTVKDNIRIGKPGASFEEVVEAARMAGADEFIEQLPQRYDTQIEEGGANLSGGQKKLLELARALMREPKIVLLDEIGAGINRTLLAKIAEKIKQLNRERGLTFCLIEHDLDYVSKLCDNVVVMAQGAVLTRGSVEAVRKDERVIEAYFGGGKYEHRA